MKAGLVAGAAGAGALAAPAIVKAQETIRWTMASSWPKGAPGVGVNAERVAEKITAMSGGRISIDFFAGGELVPPFEVFDAVAGGSADLAHTTPYYAVGKDQAMHFFTGVPFGLTALEHIAWLRFGGGQALWERAYEPFGLKPFYTGSSGPQAGGWFREEITSLDDLQGLNFRVAGLGGEVMRRIGVNPVLLPPPEIFPAMQNRTIDAAEWIGPWNDLAFGLFRVAKHYYMPAFHEMGPALELIVSQESYDALPADLQAVVEQACLAAAMETTADFTFHNIVSLRPLVEEHGVQVHTMPDSVIDALARESGPVLEEVAESSPIAGETFASFRAFLTEANTYAQASDLAALQMRAKALGM
ncbi:MAG: TRAP transporter substrate-binding protein [Devosiaceae bacterium]|nr:TRAP transporter substrate-binding protein [Devosiaceae bacterium MH13]